VRLSEKCNNIGDMDMTSAPGTAPTLIIGNWKMNGTGRDVAEGEALVQALGHAVPEGVTVGLAPAATLLHRMAGVAKSGVWLGGQDCAPEASGAFTGDISPEMLKDAGAKFVILGHSERRNLHNETDSDVRAKVKSAVRAGLFPIVCVGETAGERQKNRTIARISRQMNGSLDGCLNDVPFAIAYEPVWAIGTGLTPTVKDIAAVHASIRARLVERFGPKGMDVAILYGGSVKVGNAGDIASIDNVNGALVGGASLKGSDFAKLVQAVAGVATPSKKSEPSEARAPELA